jgi:phytoene synthase
VGLCSIAIFGYSDPRAQDYAINLGVALQLTNILRDVQVDARIGRVYLPQEDLRRFGVSPDELRLGRYSPAFEALMAFEATRAREYYARAWRGFPPADRRSLFAAEIMGRTYFALLQAIEARGFDVFGERVTVPSRRRIAIALACWARSRLGTRGRSPLTRPAR